jgi:hypothetical protein
MWQVAAFIDLRIVKPIIIGDDDPARDFDVVDAASFSSAILGVLHHETSDPFMIPILDALCEDKDVAALVDGGAASNVPVELAWKRIRDGRLGTRNACYLAFDCFHPQWDPRHLWLVPITQAIQLQMVRNLPYADHLVRFGHDAVAGEPGALRCVHRSCEQMGEQQCRAGDPSDDGAAAADLVGRRWPSSRQAQDTREVGGVADERSHGSDSGADESFCPMAKPLEVTSGLR